MIAQQKPQPPATVKVKVLRPFYFGGKVLEKNSEPTLPRLFALEMQAAHKVEIAKEEAQAPAAQPKQAEPAEKKGDRNAR